MPRIVTTPFADDDLVVIWRYIAKREQDFERADALYSRIVARFERLSSQPTIGHLRRDLGPGVRTSAVGKYIIIYIPIDDGIEVYRVVHGARDIPRIFEH